MRNSLILVLLLSLAGCGDPLAKFEQIEDVELAPEQDVAQQALPDANEVAPTEGLLGRLLSREPVSTDVEDVAQEGVEATTPVAAEIDTDTGIVIDTGTDAGIDADAALPEAKAEIAVIEAAPAIVEPPATGLRGWLKRAAAAAPEVDDTDLQADVVVAIETPPDAVVEPAKSNGVFGDLTPVQDGPETVQTASLVVEEPQTPPTTGLVEPKKRGGLFGNARREAKREEVRNGPDARDVAFGTVLPFGEIARVCEAGKTAPLGRLLEKVPFHGRGFSLYDSAPDTTTARTFYVTGFKDKCPRQFTAALAIFGSALVHEQLRYGRPSTEYPYSTTDQAYEKIKKSVCKVGNNKPCGPAIALMQNHTVFISTYEKFTDNARWADILLHDGFVVAAALKTP